MQFVGHGGQAHRLNAVRWQGKDGHRRARWKRGGNLVAHARADGG
jgi:hypothetical protein